MFIGLVGITAVICAFYQLTQLTERHTTFLPPAGEHLKPKKTQFKVAFFSDSGLREDPLEHIVEAISKSNNAFTIFCGDIADDLSFGGFSHLCEEISEKLTIPLYAVPGNHDIEKDGNLNLYRQFFGQDRYYFSYGDTLFIGLNTTRGFPEENRVWLANILQKERQHYKRCVIYCHIPPADFRPNGKGCLRSEDADRFYKAIKGHSISMIISGHLHEYAFGKFHDVDLLILPSSGQQSHKKKETPYGYAQLIFHKDGTITHEVILDTNLQGREYLEYLVSIHTTLLFWMGIILIFPIGIILYRKVNAMRRNKS